jgi:predicted LPLAT superfamily acyltransferase
MAEQHWAKTEERGSYWGILFVLRAYQYGGHWLMRLVLAPVITYFFLTGKAARRASCEFLQRVHEFAGGKSPFTQAAGWRKSWYHFWQFGLHALEKIDAWVGKSLNWKSDPKAGCLLAATWGTSRWPEQWRVRSTVDG